MAALDQSAAADLFRRPPDRLVDVDGGAAALRTVGHGPHVLFVHGWPVSGATFRRLLPHLADHVTCHVIDLPGSGSSRADDPRALTFDGHIDRVRQVIDALELDSFAVVGHDSGGLIARHAVAGDPRLRALGLIDTEQPGGLGWRFRSFLAVRHLPALERTLSWVARTPWVRRQQLVFGAAFVDRSLLDGDFDEFFLQPLANDRARVESAVAVLRSFDTSLVTALDDVHRRLDVPVQLVWGARDVFFPVAGARAMVGTFGRAELAVIDGAATFAHEERPAEVAAALLPVLTREG